MLNKKLLYKLIGIIVVTLSVLFFLAIHTTEVAYPKFNAEVFERTNDSFETGFVVQEDKKLIIQLDTEMPGVTPSMVAWWFKDYMNTTEHYKRWYPGAHLWMDWENKSNGELIGARHLVDEYIGESLGKLRIEFVDPSTLIPGYVESENRFAACAFPGPRELPLTAGIMCHDTQRTETGSVMRSIFHIGHIYKRDSNGNLTTEMPTLFNQAFIRSLLAGEQFGIDMLDHAKTEMSILGIFLPEIYYAEEANVQGRE